MSRSQRPRLPLGIHTQICTEGAAVASQRAVIAICVLLLTVFSFKIRLPPLLPNFQMKHAHICGLTALHMMLRCSSEHLGRIWAHRESDFKRWREHLR